jgi:YggT family protein
MTTTTTVKQPDPTVPARPSSTWTATRLVALLFTVLEVLLLIRFTMKLFGANAEQPLAAAIYGVTEPLVAPFRGIFGQPAGSDAFDIPALLAVVFFLLVAGLGLAMIRAFTGRQSEPTS